MIDLSGKKFGILTVLKVSEERKRNILSWDCVCDCGNTKTVAGPDLRDGSVKSCGCQQFKGFPKDVTGQRNGSLVAVSSTNKKTSNGDYIWNFKCDCGGSRELSLGMFSSKIGLACKKCTKDRVRSERMIHGFPKNHKTYKVWARIIQRCYNPNNQDYYNYGAKGITMSDNFKDNFLAFYAEIGEPPSKDHSVDRIDFSKGYIEGNIRWATDEQQARNKGKMKTNSSGFTGVHWEDKLHPNGVNSTTYAVVQWKEYDKENNRINGKKSFSVKKYGLLEAFAMACEYRDSKIKELNQLGYGYTDTHGK